MREKIKNAIELIKQKYDIVTKYSYDIEDNNHYIYFDDVELDSNEKFNEYVGKIAFDEFWSKGITNVRIVCDSAELEVLNYFDSVKSFNLENRNLFPSMGNYILLNQSLLTVNEEVVNYSYKESGNNSYNCDNELNNYLGAA